MKKEDDSNKPKSKPRVYFQSGFYSSGSDEDIPVIPQRPPMAPVKLSKPIPKPKPN